VPSPVRTIEDTTARATRPEIRRLPALLVNQIAAGEVIERPASVVKELVENALDAGATRITVELEAGGVELVRVSDDGSGIEPAQLPLALAPHATSKIGSAEDLDRIATMGFRGEALASIASVARVQVRSRSRGGGGAAHGEGAEIQAAGDEVGPVRPAACPPGTTIEVRNLFFNTPARRKFLRTAATEQTRCLDWLTDLAMAHPAVGVRCVCDGKVRMDLPVGQGPRERVLELLGKELEPQLVECSLDALDDARGVLLWGLVGLPAIARATQKAQHCFLNGRAIRDKTVQHALREAYRGLIEPGRHPTAVLMLEMSPAAVDVNVHPAKLEVRFRDQSMVHSAVLRAVRDALRSADLTPGATSRVPTLGAGGSAAILPGGGSGSETGVGSGGGSGGPFVEYFRREGPADAQARLDYHAMRAAIEGSEGADGEGDARVVRPVSIPGAAARAADHPGVREVERVLQVHRSYLVTQDERGLVIVDQHALHERVMFETLLARLDRAGRLESQALLTPAVVDAAPAQIDRLGELSGLLERLGIEASPLSPRSVGVRAFPTLLFARGVDPVAFVAELLERAESSAFAPGSEEALHEVLDMMACKAAVKAGDRLSEGEMIELMEARERVERSGSCPHGRATTVRVTIAELEKLFDRR
jgi:DNA mismatch repair protein MutL